MTRLALVFAAALALGVDGQSSNYDTICWNHTMSVYPVVGPACGAPPGPFVSGVSPAEIATIVDTHNALRRGVAAGAEILGAPGPQPKAANMRNMTWDAELATIAQRWASQCLSGNDYCRKVARFKFVGQNVYKSLNEGPGGPAPWTASINSWYNEVSLFNSNNVDPFVSVPAAKQYTQLAWASTYLVGCGYAYYKSNLLADIKNPYVKITVCNYGPTGNAVGTSMYKIGSACSQCPVGTVCSSNLCK